MGDQVITKPRPWWRRWFCRAPIRPIFHSPDNECAICGTRAYYLNSLMAWRDALLDQRQSLMARPDKRDQGYRLEINAMALKDINDALRSLGSACCIRD
jgi:hypothetical protein